MKKIRIAIQKNGRLTTDSINFLTSNLKYLTKRARILNCASSELKLNITDNIEILYVRNSDIPKLVQIGAADLGITGFNTIVESNCAERFIRKLDFAFCRLSLAVPISTEFKSSCDLQNKLIATSFPRSLKNFLDNNNLKARIIELQGSVELAPSIGLADAIVDLVCSGKTLAKNNLREICTLYESQAYLIGNQELANQIFYFPFFTEENSLQAVSAK